MFKDTKKTGSQTKYKWFQAEAESKIHRIHYKIDQDKHKNWQAIMTAPESQGTQDKYDVAES